MLQVYYEQISVAGKGENWGRGRDAGQKKNRYKKDEDVNLSTAP